MTTTADPGSWQLRHLNGHMLITGTRKSGRSSATRAVAADLYRGNRTLIWQIDLSSEGPYPGADWYASTVGDAQLLLREATGYAAARRLAGVYTDGGLPQDIPYIAVFISAPNGMMGNLEEDLGHLLGETVEQAGVSIVFTTVERYIFPEFRTLTVDLLDLVATIILTDPKPALFLEGRRPVPQEWLDKIGPSSTDPRAIDTLLIDVTGDKSQYMILTVPKIGLTELRQAYADQHVPTPVLEHQSLFASHYSTRVTIGPAATAAEPIDPTFTIYEPLPFGQLLGGGQAMVDVTSNVVIRATGHGFGATNTMLSIAAAVENCDDAFAWYATTSFSGLSILDAADRDADRILDAQRVIDIAATVARDRMHRRDSQKDWTSEGLPAIVLFVDLDDVRLTLPHTGIDDLNYILRAGRLVKVYVVLVEGRSNPTPGPFGDTIEIPGRIVGHGRKMDGRREVTFRVDLTTLPTVHQIAASTQEATGKTLDADALAVITAMSDWSAPVADLDFITNMLIESPNGVSATEIADAHRAHFGAADTAAIEKILLDKVSSKALATAGDLFFHPQTVPVMPRQALASLTIRPDMTAAQIADWLYLIGEGVPFGDTRPLTGADIEFEGGYDGMLPEIVIYEPGVDQGN